MKETICFEIAVSFMIILQSLSRLCYLILDIKRFDYLTVISYSCFALSVLFRFIADFLALKLDHSTCESNVFLIITFYVLNELVFNIAIITYLFMFVDLTLMMKVHR